MKGSVWLQGSGVYVRALEKAGMVTQQECEAITRGLATVRSIWTFPVVRMRNGVRCPTQHLIFVTPTSSGGDELGFWRASATPSCHFSSRR